MRFASREAEAEAWFWWARRQLGASHLFDDRSCGERLIQREREFGGFYTDGRNWDDDFFWRDYDERYGRHQCADKRDQPCGLYCDDGRRGRDLK